MLARSGGVRLVPLVYEDLRRRAAAALQSERSGHTLTPTALVNEAYLRLGDQQSPRFESRKKADWLHSQAVEAALSNRGDC